MVATFTVSRLARQFGVAPQKISDLFYRRKLSDSDCPVVDGRRQIPADYVPTVERVLREHGVLKNQEAGHAS
jgi:hypothetical protein